MFNDVLLREDCASLLGRLANCAFPFQCAHGRPSMVPLVYLRSDLPVVESEAAGSTFFKEFKRWKHGADRDASTG